MRVRVDGREGGIQLTDIESVCIQDACDAQYHQAIACTMRWASPRAVDVERSIEAKTSSAPKSVGVTAYFAGYSARSMLGRRLR